jgi:hypothetical protein
MNGEELRKKELRSQFCKMTMGDYSTARSIFFACDTMADFTSSFNIDLGHLDFSESQIKAVATYIEKYQNGATNHKLV